MIKIRLFHIIFEMKHILKMKFYLCKTRKKYSHWSFLNFNFNCLKFFHFLVCLYYSSNRNHDLQIFLAWLFVCLSVSNKHQNGWTNRAQLFIVNLHDFRMLQNMKNVDIYYFLKCSNLSPIIRESLRTIKNGAKRKKYKIVWNI